MYLLVVCVRGPTYLAQQKNYEGRLIIACRDMHCGLPIECLRISVNIGANMTSELHRLNQLNRPLSRARLRTCAGWISDGEAVVVFLSGQSACGILEVKCNILGSVMVVSGSPRRGDRVCF